MAAVTYTKGDWYAEADIQPVSNGKYQGVVLIKHDSGTDDEESEYTVNTISNTPAEALEEAKALAHRILSDR
jgi:hypothetical protein